MKNAFLTIMSVSFFFAAVASADVKFSQEEIDLVLSYELMKTDLKSLCSTEGLNFAKEMATSLRQVAESVPESQVKTKKQKSLDKKIVQLEYLCANAIKAAKGYGLSDVDIKNILQK